MIYLQYTDGNDCNPLLSQLTSVVFPKLGL
jgi:hypothetical protein